MVGGMEGDNVRGGKGNGWINGGDGEGGEGVGKRRGREEDSVGSSG